MSLSTNIAKQMIQRVRDLEKEKDIAFNDLSNIKTVIYDILNEGKLTDKTYEQLKDFISTYDNTNDIIEQIQNAYKGNIKRIPKQKRELTYNQMIYQELSPYRDIVGFGLFSRVLRSNDPKRVYEMIIDGGEYNILIQLLEIYIPYLVDVESAPSRQRAEANNFYIIDRLQTAFENFLNSLEEKGLI